MKLRISPVIFLAAVTSALFLAGAAGGQDIPAGVTYKKTTDEINRKAKRILEDALNAKSDAPNIEARSGAIACGPLLWAAIKDKAGKELHDANPMIVIIQAAKPIRMEGRGVSEPAAQRAFWKLFIDNVKGSNSYSIRKAEASEIQYYWATIPFDIEEPFYIVDLGKVKVLVNFIVKGGDPRIFWMDIVGDLKTLK